MTNTGEIQTIISHWKKILDLNDKSWVVFEHGTIVIFPDKVGNLKEEAIELMKTWGPVVPGTNLGDFSVTELDNNLGWTIHYCYDNILNYVTPSELEIESEDSIGNNMFIGLTGREKRKNDAKDLQIIHIEEK